MPVHPSSCTACECLLALNFSCLHRSHLCFLHVQLTPWEWYVMRCISPLTLLACLPACLLASCCYLPLSCIFTLSDGPSMSTYYTVTLNALALGYLLCSFLLSSLSLSSPCYSCFFTWKGWRWKRGARKKAKSMKEEENRVGLLSLSLLFQCRGNTSFLHRVYSLPPYPPPPTSIGPVYHSILSRFLLSQIFIASIFWMKISLLNLLR